jgi:hypothetical protein
LKKRKQERWLKKRKGRDKKKRRGKRKPHPRKPENQSANEESKYLIKKAKGVEAFC